MYEAPDVSYYEWRRYVPAATLRARAQRRIDKLRKDGLEINPITITGRKIAQTFWGEAWCRHLESLGDYESRLPRGRTYVRNGSVCHLDITRGEVNALVSGSVIYRVNVLIETLPAGKWKKIKSRCVGEIASILELLQGRLSDNVMSVVTDPVGGLFPGSKEISLSCSCPDWANMCKHVAAVLYGVGARLDEKPELLFLLRGVDHEELIGTEVNLAAGAGSATGRKRIADDALADVFGIELSDAPAPRKPPAEKPTKARPRQPVIAGADVSRLRAKLSLSQRELAALLAVSRVTVGKWEVLEGPLRLQARTRAAIVAAKKLTKAEARRRVQALS